MSGFINDQGTTDNGSTPLFMAALHGHLEVVQFLVESSANKDQGLTNDGTKVRQISISDKTLLDAATVKRHRAIVRFFVVSCHETHVGLFETSWVIFPGSEVSASN